jgi:hypothetical protein
MSNDEVDLTRVPVPGVPFWALPLVQQVAEIRALVAAIPKLERELDTLRGETVPMVEHVRLLQQVSELRDLSREVMPQWSERRPRLDAMWDERTEMKGTMRAFRWALAGLGGLNALLATLWIAYQAGIRVHVGG